MDLTTLLETGGHLSYEDITAALHEQGNVLLARADGMTLASHFQPIYSLSHRRTVGHEALLRITDRNSIAVPPLPFLRRTNNFVEVLRMDRLARRLHLSNFVRAGDPRGWININIHPDIFIHGPKLGNDRFTGRLLEELKLPGYRLVFDVAEHAITDDEQLATSAAYFRRTGCLIAFDDFGEQQLNVDRVIRIQPEIVKLHRRRLVQAQADAGFRRLLPSLVSCLHDAGVLVLQEGVESAADTEIALEANIDLVQGQYFGRPEPWLAGTEHRHGDANALWGNHDRQQALRRQADEEWIAPYVEAIRHARERLAGGQTLLEATTHFRDLPDAEFCYLVDATGQTTGTVIEANQTRWFADPRYLPLAEESGIRVSSRAYFRAAVEQPEKIHVSTPYLSSATRRPCVTVCTGIKGTREHGFLCGDVRWTAD